LNRCPTARKQEYSHAQPPVDDATAFLAYFAVAIVLLALFLLVYLNVTPYHEVALIRAGNSAAAVSLSGALLGFAMPVANVIAHSDTLIDLAAWGVIAGVIQILAYLVTRFTLPQLIQDIPSGRIAPAIFLAVVSLTVGLINAACMTY
jgi:putative membrane protein